MSRAGNPYDNAWMESAIGKLKSEVLGRSVPADHASARQQASGAAISVRRNRGVGETAEYYRRSEAAVVFRVGIMITRHLHLIEK